MVVLAAITIVFSFSIFLLSDFIQGNYDFVTIDNRWAGFIIIICAMSIIVFLLEIYLSRKLILIIVPIMVIIIIANLFLPLKYQIIFMVQTKILGHDEELTLCIYENKNKEICYDMAIHKVDTHNIIYKKIGKELCHKKTYTYAQSKENNVREKQCYYNWLISEGKTDDIAQ